MKNITITLDEKTAAWARVHAAEQGKSLSRLLGEILQERMRDFREYEEAKRRFLESKPFNFDWIDGRKPTRDEINDRSSLR